MNLLIRPIATIVICVCCLSQVYANSSESLHQQVEKLTNRVSELEHRLDMLESPELKQMVEQISAPPSNLGQSEDKSNWQRLKVGYNYDEVRELLGEPVSIKKGGMEFWYYSSQDLNGPFVKFLFKKVNTWKEPAE